MSIVVNNGHRSGGSWNTWWTPELVAAAPDPVNALCEYIRQSLGVPWPTLKDMTMLRRKVKEFFRHYPRCDFYSLCRLVTWCKARRIRFGRVWQVLDKFRDAYVAGALPELDPVRHDEDLDQAISNALATESDPQWKRRLLAASGVEARREAYALWREYRAS